MRSPIHNDVVFSDVYVAVAFPLSIEDHSVFSPLSTSSSRLWTKMATIPLTPMRRGTPPKAGAPFGTLRL